MSQQISLTTFATLVLSACCTTLSQGATPLDTPQTSAPAVVSSMQTTDQPDLRTAISAVGVSVSPNASPTTVSDVITAPTLVSKTVDTRLLPTIKPPAKTKPLKKITKTPPPRPVSPSKPVINKHEAAIPAFNRPYVAFGQTHTPLQSNANFSQQGEATWYSKSHQGQPTINGEIYDVYGMTAAHPTLPIPSYARVTNLSNRKSVIVRINDRGPFTAAHKIIELSYAAANKIGMVGSENRQVEIVSIASETRTPIKNKAPIFFNFPAKRTEVKSLASPTLKTNAKPIKPLPALRKTGIYVQLGAFKTAASAQAFMQKMHSTLGNTPYPLTTTLQDKLHRVHMGSYPDLDSAQRAVVELNNALGFKPLVKQIN